VPGTVEVWRWRPVGYFGKWQDFVVESGGLDDGRWYVRALAHDLGGPWRAELFDSRDEAMAAAKAVQAKVEVALNAAGYRLL